MTDAELLGLNIYEEAAGQIPDGRAAIARVVKNRMALKFFSDGTIAGTILRYDQFSWAWFEYKNGRYQRTCTTPEQAEAQAAALLKTAMPKTLAACVAIGQEVMAGTYDGTLYDQLTDDAVLYVNPRILTKPPAWAIPSALVCTIGQHDFYRANSAPLVA